MFDKLYIQRLYADQLGSRLERHRVQSYSPYKSNFRCHICGDSATNKFKKRGFILEKDKGLIYYCHNECGTIGFERYLKEYHGDLYTMYKFDVIKSLKQDYKEDEDDQVEEIQSDNSFTLDSLDIDKAITSKKAYQYLRDRMIPDDRLDDIFLTKYFYKFVNQLITDKFPEQYESKVDARLVFPMRYYNGEIFGVVGRAIDPSNSHRYLTIKFDDDKPKIFGLEKLNKSLFAYVVEGPIDSMFVNNGIALAGTDGNPDDIFLSVKDYAVILDNQPRSKSVIKKYQKYIDKGCKMVIWPPDIHEKDINDMVISGISIQKINEIIRLNTFEGLKLKIMFNQWRKI